MNKVVKSKLLEIRDQIDELLNQEELTFVGTFYGTRGEYELYLFTKSTEKCLNWYDARSYCKSLGGELPTIGELRFIYDNELDQTFEHSPYWSSKECSSSTAYRYYFNYGDVYDSNKATTNYIRPVKRYYT